MLEKVVKQKTPYIVDDIPFTLFAFQHVQSTSLAPGGRNSRCGSGYVSLVLDVERARVYLSVSRSILTVDIVFADCARKVNGFFLFDPHTFKNSICVDSLLCCCPSLSLDIPLHWCAFGMRLQLYMEYISITDPCLVQVHIGLTDPCLV